MISLPLFDTMTHHEVDQVVEALQALLDAEQGRRRPTPSHSKQPVQLVHA
jgi:hypothetical protein